MFILEGVKLCQDKSDFQCQKVIPAITMMNKLEISYFKQKPSND